MLGPFDYNRGGDYAFVLLQSDISAWSEWVLAAVIVATIILFLASRRYEAIISRYRTVLGWLMGAGALISVVFAGVAIGTGLFTAKGFLLRSVRFIGWTEPLECIIGGLVFLVCAVPYLAHEIKSPGGRSDIIRKGMKFKMINLQPYTIVRYQTELTSVSSRLPLPDRDHAAVLQEFVPLL